MTVAENLILGRAHGARLDLGAARAMVREASRSLGTTVDPDARVEDLSVGEQQRVEILKALSRDCRVLILDEPTAVLVPQEVEALFATLRQLVSEGMSVVFISHKLPEVGAICDRVTVLRRGRVVGTTDATTDERELARMMVGRATFGVARAGTRTVRADPPVLRIEGLSAIGRHGLPALRDIDLAVRPGEIVGVAGVSGNGQTELVEVLSGMRAADHGVGRGRRRAGGRRRSGGDDGGGYRAHPRGPAREPRARHVGGAQPRARAPRRLRARRPPGQRRASMRMRATSSGVSPSGRVRTTVSGHCPEATSRRCSWRGSCRGTRVWSWCPSPRAASTWVPPSTSAPSCWRDAQGGAAILLVSEDLDELLALSDRIVVLYEGAIVGDLSADDADPERLGMLMAGRGRRLPERDPLRDRGRRRRGCPAHAPRECARRVRGVERAVPHRRRGPGHRLVHVPGAAARILVHGPRGAASPRHPSSSRAPPWRSRSGRGSGTSERRASC